MKSKSEKKLDDCIFKSNSKIKIYDSKVIGYDTISDYFFYKEMYDNYILSKQYYELQIDENKGNIEDLTSLGYMDNAAKNLIAGYNKKIQSGLEQVNLANTFIESYKAHKLPSSRSKYYLFKEYIKASIFDLNGKQTNMMDTIRNVFDDNLNLVDSIPREILSRFPKYREFDMKILDELE